MAAACGVTTRPPEHRLAQADAAGPSVAPVVLPLDVYRPTAGERAVLFQAEGIVFRRCMARFGLTVVEPAVAQQQDGERYLLADESVAAARGYHPSGPVATGGDATLPPGYLDAAGGRGRRQVNGRTVPPGGCGAEAASALTGRSDPIDLHVVDALRARSWNESQRDGRVGRLFAAWSACMRAAGYNYRSPREANNDPTFATPQATPREVATAVADVRCKRQVRLVETWSAVETRYQQQLIGQYAVRLAAVKKAIQERLTAARKVIAAG